jgi:hypothetical protein
MLLWSHFFGDFRQISAEKLAFFFKNQCYDPNLSQTGSILYKSANFFAKFFDENISKIITSVPELKNKTCSPWPYVFVSFFNKTICQKMQFSNQTTAKTCKTWILTYIGYSRKTQFFPPKNWQKPFFVKLVIIKLTPAVPGTLRRTN